MDLSQMFAGVEAGWKASPHHSESGLVRKSHAICSGHLSKLVELQSSRKRPRSRLHARVLKRQLAEHGFQVTRHLGNWVPSFLNGTLTI